MLTTYKIWRKTFAQVEAFIRFRKRENKYLLKYSEEFSDLCTSEEFSELCSMWLTALLNNIPRLTGSCARYTTSAPITTLQW